MDLAFVDARHWLKMHCKEASRHENPSASQFAQKLVAGLSHLHSLNIICVDIEPKNMLLLKRGGRSSLACPAMCQNYSWTWKVLPCMSCHVSEL